MQRQSFISNFCSNQFSSTLLFRPFPRFVTRALIPYLSHLFLFPHIEKLLQHLWSAENLAGQHFIFYFGAAGLSYYHISNAHQGSTQIYKTTHFVFRILSIINNTNGFFWDLIKMATVSLIFVFIGYNSYC